MFTRDENFTDADVVVSDLGEIQAPFKRIKGKTFGNKVVNIDLLEKIIAN